MRRPRLRARPLVLAGVAAVAMTVPVSSAHAWTSPRPRPASDVTYPIVTTEQVNGLTVTTTTFADGSTAESVDGSIATEEADNTDPNDAAGESDGGFEFGQPSTVPVDKLAEGDCNAPSEYDQLVAMGVSPREAAKYADPVDIGAGCSSTPTPRPWTFPAPAAEPTSAGAPKPVARGGTIGPTRWSEEHG